MTRENLLQFSSPDRQRGITTLLVSLVLLAILTIIVLFSTNVAFFEQRTTTSENRAIITEQMAEFALNLSGEYLKQNRATIISKTPGGWLEVGGTGAGWLACEASDASPHPCGAERDLARRARMYYFDANRSTDEADEIEPLPYSTITGSKTGALTGADPTTRYTDTSVVNALLCRIEYDTSDPVNKIPRCDLLPNTTATTEASNNIAVTLIANESIGGENSAATVKETWATAIIPLPAAALPLIASGSVSGIGNATIVASPNAGGFGVVGSIWAPSNVDFGDTAAGCGGAGGFGSPLTCHIGEYLGSVPYENLKTTCAGAGTPCDCPAMSSSGTNDSLSGHSGATKVERADILDMDGDCGSPSITFFPREPFDKGADPSDDSLFEYTFGADYVVNEGSTTVNTNCPSAVVTGQTNCARFALTDELSAQILPNCTSLNASSSGIYYITGACTIDNVTGSATNPVVVVVEQTGVIKNNFFGMFFVRSDNNTGTISNVGNFKLFGSMVVEGTVSMGGNIQIVYDNANVKPDPNVLPRGARFGRVSGSWLDSMTGL